MTITTEKIKDMAQEVAGEWLDFKALSGAEKNELMFNLEQLFEMWEHGHIVDAIARLGLDERWGDVSDRLALNIFITIIGKDYTF